MATEELRRLLDRLEAEIRASEDLSPAQRRELERLRERVERALELGGDDEEAEALPDSLGAQLERFGASHPTLTMILGRIMDALNKMGI